MKYINLIILIMSLIVPVVSAQDTTPIVEVIPIQSHLPQFQLSPDGKTIAFYEDSRLQNEEINPLLLPIQLIDVETGEVRATMFNGIDYTRMMAISPDSSILATTEFNGDMFIWDTETGDLIKKIDGIPSQTLLEFLDGNHLLSVSGFPLSIIAIWDISSESIIRVISPQIGTYDEYINQPPMEVQGNSISAITINPNDEELIIATQMDEIFLVDIESGDRSQMRYSDAEFPQLNIRELIPAPESDQVFYALLVEGLVYRLNLDTRVEIEVLAVEEESRLLAFSVHEASDRMSWMVETEADEVVLYMDSLSKQGNPVEIELPQDMLEELAARVSFVKIAFSSDGHTAIIGGFVNRDNTDNVLLKLTFTP